MKKALSSTEESNRGSGGRQSVSHIEKLLNKIKILPVLNVASTEMAIEISRALIDGGIHAIELTLRTESGLPAITAVKNRFPEMVVAAGTVTSPKEMVLVKDAGADFAVSPGMTAALVRKAESLSLPFLPGVATPSEVMMGMEMGLNFFKLFPAVPIEGLGLLQSIAEPLPEARFCPTGGVSGENYRGFLKLENVVCVGGSWLVPDEFISNRNWSGVTELVRQSIADV